jgi:xanthine/uracil permease
VLTPATWWERIVIGIIVTIAIVLAAVISQRSILDAVLVGLATVAGLGLVYQDEASTTQRRLQQLSWLAFVEVVFVALSDI